MGRIGDLKNRSAVEFHFPRDRVEQRLAVVKTFVVTDIDPVAVCRIRLRRHHKRRPALKIVVAHEPNVLGIIRHRIWGWSTGAGAGSQKPEARSQKPEDEQAYPVLASGFLLLASPNSHTFSIHIHLACVTTSTKAGSPRFTAAIARRSAGARSLGSVMGPSA